MLFLFNKIGDNTLRINLYSVKCHPKNLVIIARME